MNEILLNIMYAGKYIESDNIGHEIINLFKSDQGKNYIYAMPGGTIAKQHEGNIRCVLMVRRINANTLEILGKTVGKLTQILTETVARENNDEQRTKIHSMQIEKIEKDGIMYGGKKLNEIFKKNGTNDKDAYITFEADDVVKPKNRIYLTTNEKWKEAAKDGFFYLPDEDLSADGSKLKFPKQSMKTYLSDENPKTSHAFKVVTEIINDTNLWGDSVPTVKVDEDDQENETPPTFMKIIRKEYDELSYSNMLAFFFRRNRKVFCDFAKEVLKIDMESNFTIEREWEHIDLLITDENNVIVIENKIKSAINGVKDSGESQLSDYVGKVNNEKAFKNKNKHFFILSPNYMDLHTENLNNAEDYKSLRYSVIYGFYKDKKDYFNDIPQHYAEFLAALEKQSKPKDNSLEEEMYDRFHRAIKEA